MFLYALPQRSRPEKLDVVEPALYGLGLGRCQRPLSVLALALKQEVRLCLVQSLRDVRDQIGRVFDADRQPDRGIENAYFLADISRNAGVRHACGQAGKRFGAAQSSPPA